MAKHIHADLMMEYAKLAQETGRPWEHFEVLHDDADRWCSLAGEFYFDPDSEYRRKPRTIRIGNIEVPEPVDYRPEVDCSYYVPSIIGTTYLSDSHVWINCFSDHLYLDRGLIHLDRESAELHAKALISLTQK
ncbi:hypothetical protein [Xenorhabdus bovienii]|uniref:Uncharacterized protein n=1 Tax=Xenorhabdus bovienii TaxID=40576 RepID=A0AAJ1N579_XENBV|nr:hypothetical protein [Xenorhabdus bovienii]MDE1479426.1 hypothetical protein [Xenorhabdus bovienii]MDE9511077.1 hypothetical protein [Xenorhabdus bovienii]MDE9522734.1 hypothetical protein [Xenorhabdus bovienii]MDE9537041.1 hypothetical protein [Xenorhabdus bovienii]MDE9590056.1 hypothetical protein [Xenorhabdus bovienii]